MHRRDDQSTAVGGDSREGGERGIEWQFGDHPERIDHGIAGQVDRLPRNTLAVQARRAFERRRETDVGDNAGDSSV